jgi:anti-sigma factor RsiW
MPDKLHPCARFSGETLSAYLDNDLPSTQSGEVRAHLDACPACSTVVAELGALAGAARRLDLPEAPPTLWLAVEGAMQRHDRPWWRTLRLLGTGAMAGAAAVSAAALAISWHAHRAPGGGGSTAEIAPPPALAAQVAPDPLLDEAEAELARAASDYERSIEKLRSLLEREEPRWSPDQRARCADRLAQLDEAIAHSRELARRSPGDSAGSDQLFAAYRQKIDFLAEAVHRGGTFREAAPERGR